MASHESGSGRWVRRVGAVRRAARVVARALVADGYPSAVEIDKLERRLLCIAPTATYNAPPAVTVSAPTLEFTVTYADDVGVDPATLGVGDPTDPGYPTSPADLTVTGPGSFSAVAAYVRPDAAPGVVPSLTATYRLAAPGGRFTAFRNGTYTVSMNAGTVADGNGGTVAAGTLGTFTVNIPAASGGNLDAGFAADVAAQAVAVQADGKVLVAGDETYGRFGLADLGEDPNDVVTARRDVLRRYNSDGTIDTTFGGGDGRVESADGPDTTIFALAVRPDGTIYAAGGGGFPAANFTLTRYTAAGAVDAGFAGGGVATVDFDVQFTGEDVAHAIGFQSDGKIVLAGHATSLDPNTLTTETDFALCRLDTGGSLDTSFGSGGLVTADMSGGGYDSIGGLVVTPTDGLLVAGSAGDRVGVALYTADGAPDAAFDGDGKKVLTTLGAPTIDAGAGAGDFHVGLARQGDGKIVVASATTDGGGFAVARLDAAGAADAAFGSAGLATSTFGGADDADRVVVLPSGKLLVLGTTTTGGNTSTAALALTTAGAADASFGTGGRRALDATAVVAGVRPSAAAPADAAGNVLVARGVDVGASRVRRLAGDFTPPAAALTPVADVTAAGGTALTLSVTFTDDVAVSAASVAAGAILVTGPSGSLTVSLVSVMPGTDNASLTAVFTAAAPGGAWDVGDNGNYSVVTVPNVVSDTTGANFVPTATIGSFVVNIVPGAPTAALVAVPPITAAGGTTQTLTVTYTAAAGGTIDAATIDAGDVRVVAPGGGLLSVTGVTTSGGGATLAATYTVAAPGGAWDAADNGDYVVSSTGQVAAADGRMVVSGVLGSFNVNVAGGGDAGTPLGDFGVVSGKRQKLTYTDADGTKITFTLARGTGQASLVNGQIRLAVQGASTLTISGKGGDGRVTLGDVTTDGSLTALTAPAADLAGTLSINGDLKKATLGGLAGTIQLSGMVGSLDVRGPFTGGVRAGGGVSKLTLRGAATGTIVAGGMISRLDARGGIGGVVSAGGGIAKVGIRGDLTGTLAGGGGSPISLSVAGNVTGATVLAGADLGTDGQVGGTGADADTFDAGIFSTIKITGNVTHSLFGAGLDPVNGTFRDGDDRVVGGTASVIRTIAIKGTLDPASKFVAGAFGHIRSSGPIEPSLDSNFEVL